VSNFRGPLHSLRQHFPKFTDLTKYRPQDLIQVENELNNRPRLILGGKPPVELFNQLLAFQKYRVIGQKECLLGLVLLLVP